MDLFYKNITIINDTARVISKYLRCLENYLSFYDGEIFADVTDKRNETTANRKILFANVRNLEMLIVYDSSE